MNFENVAEILIKFKVKRSMNFQVSQLIDKHTRKHHVSSLWPMVN